MSNKNILIVDDNIKNLELLEYLLTYHQYVVQTATNGVDAMKILTSFRPRLILTDLQMPGINGYELIKKIKQDPNLKNVLIVAITSYAMKNDEDKVKDARFDGYITKPININTLPDVIASYMQ